MIRNIRRLAKATRRELSPFIKKHSKNSFTFNDDWKCSCLVCSWLLTKVLRAHGYDAKLISGWFKKYEHAFVMVEDLVIDITATQFGLSPVLICKYKGSNYRTDQNDYQSRREMKLWPDSQQPRTYRRELDIIYRKLI